jgi:hypothetical protein
VLDDPALRYHSPTAQTTSDIESMDAIELSQWVMCQTSSLEVCPIGIGTAQMAADGPNRR